ncbi:N-acetyltransferase [Aquimarina addita]|uniref:N-acetyltransferase n=1 Tax=Aquimarina addita TaxID=870485 RepID=A0ABP7XFF0_9FLAO
MKITMRIANIEDVIDISYIGRKTFDQSFGHLFTDRNDLIRYLEQTFSIKKLKKSIVKSNNIYWIVFSDDIAVGYAKIQLNAPSPFIQLPNTCKLQKIYILKEYASKGIGVQLQELIFDTAITNGCEIIWLSVLKSNEKAIRFYKNNRYKVVGEHPFTIGKENFEFSLMSRSL